MNEITETSPKAATASGSEMAACEALTGARLRAIAAVLDHHERRGGDGARQSRPVVVNNTRAIAAILDHHEARQTASSAAPVALLLDSRAGAR